VNPPVASRGATEPSGKMKFPAPSYAMRRLTPWPAGSGFAAMAPVATATCSWEAGETHAPRAPAKRQTEQKRINIRLFRFEVRSSSAADEERLGLTEALLAHTVEPPALPT
jgi:hypothetical protein